HEGLVRLRSVERSASGKGGWLLPGEVRAVLRTAAKRRLNGGWSFEVPWSRPTEPSSWPAEEPLPESFILFPAQNGGRNFQLQDLIRSFINPAHANVLEM